MTMWVNMLVLLASYLVLRICQMSTTTDTNCRGIIVKRLIHSVIFDRLLQLMHATVAGHVGHTNIS